jgi:hypothetical protein
MAASGKISYVDSSSSTYKTWINSFSGRKNPGYKSQIASVVSATTPAAGQKKQVIMKPARLSYKGWTNKLAVFRDVSKLPSWWSYYRSGDYMGIPFGFTSFIDDTDPGGTSVSADNLAIARLQDQLLSFTQTVQSGEDIGEAKKTLDAIRRPMNGIRRITESVLERHIDALKRPAHHIPKALADAYLEFNFGWKPLAATIGEAIVGMQNREDFAIYKGFNATGTVLDTSSKINSSASGPAAIIIAATGWRRGKTSVRYKGVWSSSVTVPRRAVSDVLGLRAKNFLPTVWNLIPYSFLADYFTNIGDIVESLNVPWDDVRWCCKTVRREYVCNFTMTPRLDIGPDGFIEDQNSSPGSVITASSSFTRSIQVLQPVPRPEFTGFRDMTGKRWTNIAALVLSRLPIVKLLTAKAVSRDRELPQTFIRELAYARRNKKEGISFTF